MVTAKDIGQNLYFIFFLRFSLTVLPLNVHEAKSILIPPAQKLKRNNFGKLILTPARCLERASEPRGAYVNIPQLGSATRSCLPDPVREIAMQHGSGIVACLSPALRQNRAGPACLPP